MRWPSSSNRTTLLISRPQSTNCLIHSLLDEQTRTPTVSNSHMSLYEMPSMQVSVLRSERPFIGALVTILLPDMASTPSSMLVKSPTIFLSRKMPSRSLQLVPIVKPLLSQPPVDLHTMTLSVTMSVHFRSWPRQTLRTIKKDAGFYLLWERNSVDPAIARWQKGLSIVPHSSRERLDRPRAWRERHSVLRRAFWLQRPEHLMCFFRIS